MPDAAAPKPRPAIRVTVEPGSNAHPLLFTASHGTERCLFEPGRSWIQTDHHKWVTRGLIEGPQSFAVHPDGTVEFNGESFHPDHPDAAHALEERLNRRHTPPTATHTFTHLPTTPSRPAQPASSTSPRFRVHLDHLGHILVQARRGNDQTETGLRGLAHLATEGWMRQPRTLHVDPLQRFLELDGQRFGNDSEGARSLEDFLNRHFIPDAAPPSSQAIEIRENPAASTGFDIRFSILRAGSRIEVKGHLSQDKLDLLQDHDHCGLLRPDILLRISPPFLYVRQRRHDGSETRIASIDDIKYRAVSAADLERILNHPSLRSPSTLAALQPTDPTPTATPTAPPPPPAPARPSPAHPFSPPPKSPPPKLSPPVPHPHAPRAPAPPTLSAAADTPDIPPPPFDAHDPHQTHEFAFRELANRLHVPVQDILLSLPRVFTDRRFEILDFNGEEIESVLQLRTNHFYGFYLTHLAPDVVDLVYACHGTHLEWGARRCSLQPSAHAETFEHKGAALLGLGQNAANHFVFIVTPAYREWARHHERVCAEAYAHFLTAEEWLADPAAHPLIWPRNP